MDKVNTSNETAKPRKARKAIRAKKVVAASKRPLKKINLKPVITTTRKTVSVPVKEYTLVATQDTTVSMLGKKKTKTLGATRFALLQGNDIVATTGNKNLSPAKFNKKFVKETAASVLPIVKKMIKTGELSL